MLVEDNAAEILGMAGHIGIRRVVRNENAANAETAVIFGDSYAYVTPDAPGTLGRRLAESFRETHFLWAPFCWDDGYVRAARADVVITQMAERFALIVPRLEIDFRELTAETRRRRSAVLPDEISDR